MPAMRRVPGKATKIAFEILGKPANLRYRPSKKQKEINEQLYFEETQRVR